MNKTNRQLHVGRCTDRQDPLPIGQGGGNRFLHQQVDPLRGGGLGRGHMHVMGQADNQDIKAMC